jgi:predicted pyridoxine 5'-phosphate oxidase superfamily flavin-nucleotide-binding protein
MSLITEEIRRFVAEQKLAYIATVCPDGTPNLSPKGTVRVWDDDHLVFADIHSPGTIDNLRSNSAIEINIVDIFKRKGYRFKGTAGILAGGLEYDKVVAAYGEAAMKYDIKHIVVVKVDRVLPVWSPAYDDGTPEDEIVRKWTGYWSGIYRSE